MRDRGGTGGGYKWNLYVLHIAENLGGQGNASKSSTGLSIS